MLNILCVSRFFKGNDFMKAVKSEGHQVYLLTSSKLQNEAWPWESLTDQYYMPEDEDGNWNMTNLVNGLSYTMQTTKFDILVSLDDFDVENTAFLREYFRIDGMGETTARYFRDKLAMRVKAQNSGILVPPFVSLFYNDEIKSFTEKIAPPYMIKPRGQASATGIKKVNSVEELWKIIHDLGNERHKFLLEKFAPGDVYHVDSLSFDGKVIFSKCSKYLATPFEVAHSGGIFRSMTVALKSTESKALSEMNEALMNAFGMQYSASHTEFIIDSEGKVYFLETSCRVGGANIAEMVEAATGINLWSEWAKIEIASKNKTKYTLPKAKNLDAGIIISLSKFKNPDIGQFIDDEIVWKMKKDYHIGMIVASKSQEKILNLLDSFADIIMKEYHAALPAPKSPTN
jgi:biotin carboxylase